VLFSFIAAAAAGALTLDVPYLPQTDALCGGAAVTMIYRYWGDAHAEVKAFAPLVDRRAGGIADAVLVNAVRQRGWTAIRFDGSLPQLHAKLAGGQPVIVLLADGRRRYHFVVVIGAGPDRIVFHDPAWGPSRSINETEFVRRWQATGFWSLLVLPPAVSGFSRASEALPVVPGFSPTSQALPVVSGFSRTSQALPVVPGFSPTRGATSESPPDVAVCDTLLANAIASVQSHGLGSAETILSGVRTECPRSAGPLRELAGLRFAERRWNDAVALARDALALDPSDSYAWDLLGSSLFMQGEATGALRAWNRIGRPRVSAVRIEGLHRARYQLITDALPIREGEVLTAGAFERSRRVLNDLPDRMASRIALHPEADGFASIDIVLRERASGPRGIADWAAASARAAVDREMRVALPGGTGQGEVWSASWRWWEDRPRVALSFAAPRVGRLPGLWQVDGSWEAQTYSWGVASEGDGHREERAHGGVTLAGWMNSAWRYAFTGGVDSWDGTRRDASLGASLERRFNADRLSVRMDGTQWLPLSGDRGFASLAVRGQFRASADTRRWDFRMASGVERTSNEAPLALWSGAGEGRARAALLRAHPLLVRGIIDAGNARSFGRTLVFGSAEVQRWFERPRLPRVGIAGFADTARGSRGLTARSGTDVDVGAGVRIRVPGWDGALAVDAARGLRDARTALTFGWQF
jgi:hypothetical protein